VDREGNRLGASSLDAPCSADIMPCGSGLSDIIELIFRILPDHWTTQPARLSMGEFHFKQTFPQRPMNAPSPARRVRSMFMGLGTWVSALAFFVIESNALLDQLEIGHASTMFMLGTACLTAAACIALFAIIAAIGLAISFAFSEETTPQQSGHQAAAAFGAHMGHLPGVSRALGSTGSRRHQRRPILAPSLVRHPYCGGSEPRYEEIAMMSSSDRLATTGFINAAAFPALEPCRIS